MRTFVPEAESGSLCKRPSYVLDITQVFEGFLFNHNNCVYRYSIGAYGWERITFSLLGNVCCCVTKLLQLAALSAGC